MHDARKKWQFALVPLSWLYGLLTGLRNLLFDFNIFTSKQFDRPVVSIGNITVGGTGKTPHTEYIIRLLANYRTAVLSRGYKRKTTGYVLADEKSDSNQIGDEPRQIKAKFPKLPVAVDANRRRGIARLIQDKPKLQVILLDDAFQHRWVKPSLSIVLVDYNRPVYEDSLLPSGNLREGFRGMSRANIVVITKTPRNIKPIEKRVIAKNLDLYPYQKMFFSSLKYGALKAVFPGVAAVGQADFEQGKFGAIALTGIAAPQSFLEYVKQYCDTVEPISFPDHYKFKANDIVAALKKMEQLGFSKRLILTTEKDAVRMADMPDFPDEAKKYFYYIPIEIEFLEDEGDFNDTVLNMIRRFNPIS